MRVNLPTLILSLLAFSSASLAAPPPVDVPDPRKVTTEDDDAVATLFNGLKVPPIQDLSGKTFRQDIGKGYWLVEAFSPYCSHCKSLAPKWQTLYEFYYTSDPVPASSEPNDPDTSLNTFSRYYDFKFAKLNCVAFGSTCSEARVDSFPTIILFKDGEEIMRNEGDRSMNTLSKFIEEGLETIRPGSRPKDGPTLPKVGSHGDPSLATPKAAVVVHKDPLGSASDAQRAKTKPTKFSGHPEGKYRVAPAVFIEPTGFANPDGKSVNLTAESFEGRVSRTLDAWFIKFYAPWCPHCQALAPSWKAMAREMKGKLDVGEVNCDVERRLCKEMRIDAYPQVVLMRGPERIDYDGLRGLGDLVSYASNAADALTGVPDVTAEQFEALEKKEEVIFTFFYDVATTAEDFQALERLPLHIIGRAKLVKTNDPELVKRFKIHTWPQLLVVRDGQVASYPGLSPGQMRDVPRVTKWMQQVWLPLVPEVTVANAREIMADKFVVLGILSRERPDDFAVAKREIKNAAIEWMEKTAHAFELERQELRDAKQLRIDEAEDRKDERRLRDAKLIRIDMDEVHHKGVSFAWVDGVFWERWIRTTYGVSVKDGEKVIIIDADNHLYWDATSTGNPIVPSRTSILETLPKVITSPPKLSPKITGSSLSHAWFSIRYMVRHHHTFIVVCAVLLLVGMYVWRRVLRRSFGLGSAGFGSRMRAHSYGTASFFSLNEKGERGEGGAAGVAKAD